MLKITILCVGTLKESYWRDAAAEYTKRLKPYCNLRIVEVPEERIPESASAREREAAMRKEADRLQAQMDEKGVVVALDIKGERFSSEDLSERLGDYMVNGISHVQFLIGGSIGMDKRLLAHADLRLSFSDMTFPHQMMRVILLEQIYRAYKIQNGEPYHK